MSAWTSVTLGDVCEFKYGNSLPASAREPGPFPVYGSNGQVATHTRALTNGPTIVIGRKGSFGEVHRSEEACWPIDTTYYIDETATDADLTWLTYRLRGLGLTELNRAAAIPGLNREDAYRRPLLLPPLDEQRRIAAILDHVDSLRAKRRQVLAHLDALPQAIFRATFGDPLSAHGNRVRIGDVATVVTGNSPPRSRPELFGGRLEWIKSDNLGGLVASSATETLSDLGRGLARTAPAGSVLVTCIAGSPQSIGKASLTDREVAFNQQINAVLPCDGLEPHFLLAQLHTAPELIRRKSTGGMKGLVNKSAFQSIEVLAPPVSSQRRFSARLAGIARYRSHIESAALHQDELFASLQSRAFGGEL